MVGTISRQELKAKMDRGDAFTLVEALDEAYYRRSHLPGAVNLPPTKSATSPPGCYPPTRAARSSPTA